MNILKSWKERIPVFILPQKLFSSSHVFVALRIITVHRRRERGSMGQFRKPPNLRGRGGGGINLCIHELSQYLKVSHQYVVNFLFSISLGESSNYGAAVLLNLTDVFGIQHPLVPPTFYVIISWSPIMMTITFYIVHLGVVCFCHNYPNQQLAI